MRELVLEELLAGEQLDVLVLDPAIAYRARLIQVLGPGGMSPSRMAIPTTGHRYSRCKMEIRSCAGVCWRLPEVRREGAVLALVANNNR